MFDIDDILLSIVASSTHSMLIFSKDIIFLKNPVQLSWFSERKQLNSGSLKQWYINFRIFSFDLQKPPKSKNSHFSNHSL